MDRFQVFQSGNQESTCWAISVPNGFERSYECSLSRPLQKTAFKICTKLLQTLKVLAKKSALRSDGARRTTGLVLTQLFNLFVIWSLCKSSMNLMLQMHVYNYLNSEKGAFPHQSFILSEVCGSLSRVTIS